MLPGSRHSWECRSIVAKLMTPTRIARLGI
jgi:hypothetical protein